MCVVSVPTGLTSDDGCTAVTDLHVELQWLS